MKRKFWKIILIEFLALILVTGSLNIYSSKFKNIFANAEENESLLNDESSENIVIPISIDKKYLSAGESLVVNNTANYQLKYYVDDSEVVTDTLILSEEYYEKWITVKAYDSGKMNEKPVSEDKVYFSNLPVLYINTDDGAAITSKTNYKSGTMNIQGNSIFHNSEYNGKISIKGRGNSSWWGWPKKPYRIKLNEKADLFGMGSNKNWVLIANYLDECFLRNKIAYDLSKELGLESMECTWTDVVLNGDYIGNYLLCEQIRVDENRINIFDWEQEAKNVAKSIAKAEKKNGNALDKDLLTEYMKKDLSWITTGLVEFNGKIYSTGKNYDDINGGYLVEMSNEYDEISKFTTESGLKVMFRSPEYLNTNPDMMNYAQTYLNDFEKAYRSEDGYVETSEGRKHYSELADIDTMVSYWLVMEILGNNDALYKSRYAYKELNSKLKFGPVWDFDWGCASSTVSDKADEWKISKSTNGQAFYKEFLDDPLFVVKATEKYWQIRPYLESLIESDGIIDDYINYLHNSGAADEVRWNDRIFYTDSKGFECHSRGFENDSKIFKQYMCDRIAWLDIQFSSDNQLLKSTYTKYSAYPYERSEDKLMFILSNTPNDTFTIKDHAPADYASKSGKDVDVNVVVNDAETTALNVYINGLYYNSFSVSDGAISFKVPDALLSASPEMKNIILVIGKDLNGETTNKNFCTLIQTDLENDNDILPEFKTHNLVLGEQVGVNFYLDLSNLTEEEKSESYVEFIVNDKKVKDIFDENCRNITGELYGFTCWVNPNEISGIITAFYHYGNGKNVKSAYSVAEYINTIEANSDRYNEKTLNLVRSIADYSYFVKTWLNRKNSSVVSYDNIKHYTNLYDYDVIKDKTKEYKHTFSLGESDISKIQFSLSLNSNTSLNLYFTPNEGYQGDYTVTLTSQSSSEDTELMPLKQSDGRYKVIIPNIHVNLLDEMYTVSIKTTSGTAEYKVSVLSYVYGVLNSDRFEEITKNAVSSIYYYYDAILKYRDQAVIV